MSEKIGRETCGPDPDQRKKKKRVQATFHQRPSMNKTKILQWVSSGPYGFLRPNSDCVLKMKEESEMRYEGEINNPGPSFLAIAPAIAVCIKEEEELTPVHVKEEEELTPVRIKEEEELTPVCVKDEEELTPVCVKDEEELTPVCVKEEEVIYTVSIEEEGDTYFMDNQDSERRKSTVSSKGMGRST